MKKIVIMLLAAMMLSKSEKDVQESDRGERKRENRFFFLNIRMMKPSRARNAPNGTIEA